MNLDASRFHIIMPEYPHTWSRVFPVTNHRQLSQLRGLCFLVPSFICRVCHTERVILRWQLFRDHCSTGVKDFCQPPRQSLLYTPTRILSRLNIAFHTNPLSIRPFLSSLNWFPHGGIAYTNSPGCFFNTLCGKECSIVHFFIASKSLHLCCTLKSGIGDGLPSIQLYVYTSVSALHINTWRSLSIQWSSEVRFYSFERGEVRRTDVSTENVAS